MHYILQNCHVVPSTFGLFLIELGIDKFLSETNGIVHILQVLTNGIEVKLQRNALSVIEGPTGDEQDDDLEFENVQWNGSDMGELG